jgi:hypothetical protein
VDGLRDPWATAGGPLDGAEAHQEP